MDFVITIYSYPLCLDIFLRGLNRSQGPARQAGIMAERQAERLAGGQPGMMAEKRQKGRQKGRMEGRQADMKACKSSMQAGRQIGRQTCLHACLHACWQAGCDSPSVTGCDNSCLQMTPVRWGLATAATAATAASHCFPGNLSFPRISSSSHQLASVALWHFFSMTVWHYGKPARPFLPKIPKWLVHKNCPKTFGSARNPPPPSPLIENTQIKAAFF